MICVVRSHLKLSGLPNSVKEALKKKLTIANPRYQDAERYGSVESEFIQIEPRIKLWRAQDGKLYVPRGTSLNLLPKDIKFKDRRISAPVEFPSLKVALHSDQKRIVRTVIRDIRNKNKSQKRKFGTYLVVLPVAGGKTIAAASLAARLGQRTLVVVHTKLIESAWLRDLKKLFGLEPDEIGLIRGPTWRIGKQFTVASIQTLFKRRSKWKRLYKNFGTVLVDEAHTIPARTFLDCATNFPAMFRIGVTGTVKRADGLHPIMYRIFGRPFFNAPEPKGETATSLPIRDVIVKKTGFTPPETRKARIRTRTGWITKEIETDDDDWMVMIQMIVKDENRNDLIVESVCKRLRKGNICLITSNRVAHVKELARLIEAVAGKKYPGAYMVSATSKTNRNKIERRLLKRRYRWLVATTQLVKTGANIPPLDRLFMATPIAFESDVKQLLGRIRRKHPGKKDAVVYDFVDEKVGVLWRQFRRKRIAAYRDIGVERFKNMYVI